MDNEVPLRTGPGRLEAERHQPCDITDLDRRETRHVFGVPTRQRPPVAQCRTVELPVEPTAPRRVVQDLQESQAEPPVEKSVIRLIAVPLETAIAGLVARFGMVALIIDAQEIK